MFKFFKKIYMGLGIIIFTSRPFTWGIYDK